MTATPRSLEPQRLLAELGWVQALARSLVADPSAADDLAQEAWRIALERPPREAGSLRAFLAGVTRRLAHHRVRGEARRRERQREAARPVEQPATWEVVERSATQQRVVEAVMALEEPNRSTVLYRYFDGLSTPEIAERMETEAVTVRKRLSRGLAQLRSALDAEFGGDGRRWAVALISLVEPEPSRRARPWIWIGAGSAAAGLALLVGFGWFVASGSELYASYEPVEDTYGASESRDVEVASLVDTPVGRVTRQEETPAESQDHADDKKADRDAIAKLLEIELDSLDPAPDVPSKDDLRAVAKLTGVRVPELKDARLYEGEGRTRKGDAAAFTLVMLPCELGDLILAADEEGVLQGFALRGTREFDDDEWGDWMVFRLQFLSGRHNCRVLDPKTAATEKEIDELVSKIRTSEGEAATLARALYRQRVMMRENSWRFTRIGAHARSGVLPDPAWIEDWAEAFDDLAGLQAQFESYLGLESAASCADSAKVGASMLREAADAIADEDLERAGEAFGGGVYRKACQKCHNVETENFELGIYDGVRSDLSKRGVRSDLFRPGVDLWGVPDESERCRELARRVRALLLLLGSV